MNHLNIWLILAYNFLNIKISVLLALFNNIKYKLVDNYNDESYNKMAY